MSGGYGGMFGDQGGYSSRQPMGGMDGLSPPGGGGVLELPNEATPEMATREQLGLSGSPGYAMGSSMNKPLAQGSMGQAPSASQAPMGQGYSRGYGGYTPMFSQNQFYSPFGGYGGNYGSGFGGYGGSSFGGYGGSPFGGSPYGGFGGNPYGMMGGGYGWR